ncbi:ABC transporter substrate-binding protein [Agromyces sp. SYSU T00194]|uniref:ABC transporter substrate-binding protein n=1 Tax=Agromyces chitinivorans TaxID=3158560 RepID=UPI003392378E
MPPEAARPVRPLRSRRDFLKFSGAVGGGIAVGALLAACAPAGSTSTTRTTVRLWTVAAGPTDESFLRGQLDAFEQANPAIRVDLQVFPADQYANAMQLAFTSGDSPDVFRQASGQGIDLLSAHGRNWVHPITEFLDDDFTGRFPERVYDPELSSLFIDGEAYGVPSADPVTSATRLLYYNEEILAGAGFSSAPSTWSEFAEAAEKITRDGGGDVFGTALVGTSPSIFILQNLAGPQPFRDVATSPLSLLTGAPALAEPSTLETVSYLSDLNARGILTPGWESWNSNEAIQQMASGRLGMYMFPNFHAAELRRANPDLPLGIAAPPVPDSGKAGTRAAQDNVLGWWMMGSETESPEAAWQVLDFLGSVDFQRAASSELGDISVMPGVYEGQDVDPDVVRIREIADEIVRYAPNPFLADPSASALYAELLAGQPTPAPRELLFEAITRGSDFRPVAEQYDETIAALLPDALAASGLSDMSAFTFPEWNPLEDYAG